jgi:hypothetical protein
VYEQLSFSSKHGKALRIKVCKFSNIFLHILIELFADDVGVPHLEQLGAVKHETNLTQICLH